MSTLTLAIYGSCVARDIVRVTGDRFSLSGYIARQGWISAFSEPVTTPEDWGVRSNFQAKNLNGDFSSDATGRLRKLAKKSDLVVIDLASEQHGVFEWEPGRFVSATPTVKSSAYYKANKRKRHIPFGSVEHIDLFRTAADKMKYFLSEEGVFEQTIVLAAPFTDAIAEGGTLQKRYSAAALNQAYAGYYDLVRSRGFTVTEPLPDGFDVTTEKHQWGAAQNHYIDQAYEWWADVLEGFDGQTTPA